MTAAHPCQYLGPGIGRATILALLAMLFLFTACGASGTSEDSGASSSLSPEPEDIFELPTTGEDPRYLTPNPCAGMIYAEDSPPPILFDLEVQMIASSSGTPLDLDANGESDGIALSPDHKSLQLRFEVLSLALADDLSFLARATNNPSTPKTIETDQWQPLLPDQNGFEICLKDSPGGGCLPLRPGENFLYLAFTDTEGVQHCMSNTAPFRVIYGD